MYRIFIFTIFFLISYNLQGQSAFYSADTLREIRLYFYDSNWDYQLDTLYINGEKERILADVIIDGQSYDSVGVRYKGFSSVSITQIKNPFNIKLDYIIDGQDHQGIDKLKLSNVIHDPSFVREVLSYEIARNYMPASEANYANLYINDTLWGLYTNVEAVNKSFLDTHFENKYRPFFKCNPEVLDIGPTGENSNLSNVHGIDSLDYESYYDIRSNYGWSKMYDLIDTLNTYVDSVDKILNIDRVLWMHALNYTIINFDSYIGYGQNYYLYRDVTGQFNPILWDLNMSFGSFRLTDASSLYFNGFNIQQAQNMDPLTHFNQFSVASRPLLRNLFLKETHRKMYLAHIRTILQEQFINQNYSARAQSLQNLIDVSVQNDSNKFYSYSNFTTNLNSQVSLVTGDCPGISQLMNARVNYLSTYHGFRGEPTITNINPSSQNLIPGNDIWITADIQDATNVILAYRFGKNTRYKRIEMYDDGNHNDGLANDGIYGTQIMNTSNRIDYYLYAENDSAGVFSPFRAAYEFHTIKSELQPGHIVINEIMSNNQNIAFDETGNYEDWIELYNVSNNPVSTSGLYLTDTIGILHKWRLPNYLIPANGYLVIWADEDGDQGANHANFKLSNLGETLILSNSDSLVLDSITFPSQFNDTSFARFPNGNGQFLMRSPTFNSNNNIINSAVQHHYDDVFVFPNPFVNFIRLSKEQKIVVKDILGKIVYKSDNTIKVDTENWRNGIYFIHLIDKEKTIKAIKIHK